MARVDITVAVRGTPYPLRFSYDVDCENPSLAPPYDRDESVVLALREAADRWESVYSGPPAAGVATAVDLGRDFDANHPRPVEAYDSPSERSAVTESIVPQANA